jgi:hypothetical protein
MKNKKSYEAPVVKKVRLAIKNAVLATCHTSYDATPRIVGLSAPCYLPVEQGGSGCMT